MTEIKEDANTKLGTVSGEVTGIKQDLISTKEDFGRQLVDVKNVLNEGIARIPANWPISVKKANAIISSSIFARIRSAQCSAWATFS